MGVEEIRNGFEDLVVNIGTVAPNSSTPFKFNYTGSIPIWGVQAACGCTSTKVDEEGRSITGFYNAASNATSVNKSITVFFDDGQEMYIRDAHKNASVNPNKLKILLSIVGEVK